MNLLVSVERIKRSFGVASINIFSTDIHHHQIQIIHNTQTRVSREKIKSEKEMIKRRKRRGRGRGERENVLAGGSFQVMVTEKCWASREVLKQPR